MHFSLWYVESKYHIKTVDKETLREGRKLSIVRYKVLCIVTHIFMKYKYLISKL